VSPVFHSCNAQTQICVTGPQCVKLYLSPSHLAPDKLHLVRSGQRRFPCVINRFTRQKYAVPTVQIVGGLQSGASVWSQHKLCSCERLCVVQHRGSVCCRLTSLVQVAVLWLDCCCNTPHVTERYLAMDMCGERRMVGMNVLLWVAATVL
jgi:hypothetical protein